MSASTTPTKPRLRLGVSPLSWVNEVIQEFGDGTSADRILSEAKAAGFEGVETSRAFPNTAPELKAKLDDHGLSLVSGWHSGFLTERGVEAEMAEVRAHAELLAACGSEVMVYGPVGHMVGDALDVGLSKRLKLGTDAWKTYGERLTTFAEKLKAAYGLQLSYHHHLMMVAERFEEIDALMKATGPAVGLLLDTGHAVAGGFDYVRLIEAHGDRITHIHLKDVRADILADVRARDLSFNEGVRMGMFTIPGDGSIDFAPLGRFLARGSYSGWLLVEAEQDPSKAPPAETVARAHRFVTDTILRPALAGE